MCILPTRCAVSSIAARIQRQIVLLKHVVQLQDVELENFHYAKWALELQRVAARDLAYFWVHFGVFIARGHISICSMCKSVCSVDELVRLNPWKYDGGTERSTYRFDRGSTPPNPVAAHIDEACRSGCLRLDHSNNLLRQQSR